MGSKPGISRGKYRTTPSDDENRDRAIALLKMFQKRIENGSAVVEIADWWSANGISTLRIDIQHLDNS